MEDRDYIDPNKLALNFQNITPNEKTEINMEGKNFEIDVKEILSVLEMTSQKYFNQVDYSLLNTSKSLLSHFYYNEKECISKIKSYSYYKRKFYKSLIYDSIFEIFKQGPEKLIKEISAGLEKIRIIIDKKESNYEEILLEDYYNLLEQILGTKEVPKFLIRSDLKYIKFRVNYKNKEKKRPEIEKIIDYYKKIKNGNIRPFDYIHNKSLLFDIFVLSNRKDLIGNELMNNIFLDNYKEILFWFDLKLEKKSYEYVFGNFISISLDEQKGILESLFIPINEELDNQKNNEDLYLILFSSFFYCILYKMKDYKDDNIYSDNNISNSKITKFLSNVAESFILYLQNCKYNIKSLINALFTYVLSQINKNEKGKSNSLISSTNSGNSINNDNNNSLKYSIFQEENKDYDFKMMEEIINKSNDNNLKERFQQIKSKFKIEPFDFPTTLIGTLFKKIVNVFTSNYYYYANFLRLSPFQRYITSNSVTIFVSGFGSENDIHCIEWKKYIENDPRYSTYYFFHWPGDSFSKIIIKSLPINFRGIKFDSDLPKIFLETKEKAKNCGKFLSLILRSRLFFGYRQINLVAFSLGNHVVKHCLKDLNNNNDGKTIINDVIFMAGATTFKNRLNWYNIFKKVVGGRIINCYSQADYILKFLYQNCTNNEPIGNKNININDGLNGNNIVENYEFTDLNMGHLDYRGKFNDILNRINN